MRPLNHLIMPQSPPPDLSNVTEETFSMSLSRDEDKMDAEAAAVHDSAVRADGDPTAAEMATEGKIIVGWDGPDDPQSPRNWKLWKKCWTTLLISLCTTSLYMGAAIYTPAEPDMMEDFHTTRVKVALGLTLFVWGYGLGSLWFTPMSEIPLFRGRNPTYFFCQLVFCCLQIPTALVNHIAPFVVLRFLAGIFASPPLSTTGGTLKDIWTFPGLGLAYIVWAFGAISGPFLGPLIGGALVQGHGRRYPFWFMLAVSGGLLVIMIFLFPETSEQELLMRKAHRLRKETGDDRYVAPGDIARHTTSPKTVLKTMFWKPIKLTIMEPVVLVIDIHMGLVYSVMYLFFEAFPLVYGDLYGFNLVQQGAAFLPLLVGAMIGALLYLLYLKITQGRELAPEQIFGPSAIFGSVFLPLGLISFGWASARGVYWVFSMIGLLFFSTGAFFLFQSYFSFLGSMFPPSAAGSAFASNNLVRSMMGGAFPLFGTVMYTHLSTHTFPVGWGCTIIGLVAVAIIPFPVYLTLRGKQLREYAQQKYGNKLFR